MVVFCRYKDYSVRMMNNIEFVPSLLNFAKDNINDETIEFITPYIAIETFTPTVAQKKAEAARALCAWVIAMKDYTAASKVVKPRLMALSIAQGKLDIALGNLAAGMDPRFCCEFR